MSALSRVLFLILPLLLASCTTTPTMPSPDLEGGVVATFDVGVERFRVFVTNPLAIERLFEIQRGTASGSIPNGRIHRGSGAGQHNAPRRWHLDPQDVEIVQLAAEVCDGQPSYVDDHLDEYVDGVGRYCPWGARLVSIQDYR